MTDVITCLFIRLRNAPSTFQGLMNEFLEGLKDSRVHVYMDDLIVFSGTLEEHRHPLVEVLSRLCEFNLRVIIDKTHLCQEEVRFMGPILSEAGVRPDPAKIRT